MAYVPARQTARVPIAEALRLAWSSGSARR
jgi:hypothetical protein